MISDKIKEAHSWLSEMISDYKPIAVVGLFSGGHDSTSSTYIASLQPEFTAAVHVNTGIGVKRTNQFVHDTCRARGWKLIELKATENTKADGTPDPMIYRDMCLRHGFPGPGKHGVMYIKLKERALERLEREIGVSARGKKKQLIMYVTGVRSKESKRRMGNVNPVEVRGRSVWVNPIREWTKSDTSELLEFAGIPRNPVVDLIHKSGECLCGAFAEPGELEELSMWPETREAFERIIALQEEVKAAGKHCVWGTRPIKEASRSKSKPGMLCWSCK